MIERLIDEPSRRMAMGEAARVDVFARLGRDAIRDRAGRVYAAILAGSALSDSSALPQA